LHEIVLVNDGSNDNSREEILDLQDKFEYIVAINMQRNYGQATALQV
jgi:glycosyltransferase involved in cell wall biosynthesis